MRAEALLRLGVVKVRGVFPLSAGDAFVDALRSTSSGVVHAAVTTLARVGGYAAAELVPLLTDLLPGANPSLANKVGEALAWRPYVAADEVARRILSEADEEDAEVYFRVSLREPALRDALKERLKDERAVRAVAFRERLTTR